MSEHSFPAGKASPWPTGKILDELERGGDWGLFFPCAQASWVAEKGDSEQHHPRHGFLLVDLGDPNRETMPNQAWQIETRLALLWEESRSFKVAKKKVWPIPWRYSLALELDAALIEMTVLVWDQSPGTKCTLGRSGREGAEAIL